FKNGEEPLGKGINISGTIYNVVGVFSDPGGEREESRVFIPISTAQRTYSAGDKIRSMAFTLNKQSKFDEAVAKSHEPTQQLETLLKSRHTIAPHDQGALHINNSLEQAKNIYKIGRATCRGNTKYSMVAR